MKPYLGGYVCWTELESDLYRYVLASLLAVGFTWRKNKHKSVESPLLIVLIIMYNAALRLERLNHVQRMLPWGEMSQLLRTLRFHINYEGLFNGDAKIPPHSINAR